LFRDCILAFEKKLSIDMMRIVLEEIVTELQVINYNDKHLKNKFK